MLSRALFIFVLCFWLVMNLLLWRSQMEGKNRIGNSVPIATVWQKIITAPDNSTLEIFHHEKKLGTCQWVANLGQTSQAIGKALNDYDPEGMMPQLSSYSLNLEGSTSLIDGGARLHFDANLKLSTNQDWQEFRIHANLAPSSWDLRAAAKEQALHVKIDDENGLWQKTIKFTELEHPETLLQDFSSPIALGLMGLSPGTNRLDVSHAIHWEAHEDRMQFGHSRVRVYRLETKLLGQTVYVFVSLVGEILWVELPDRITLRNEAFSHF